MKLNNNVKKNKKLGKFINLLELDDDENEDKKEDF